MSSIPLPALGIRPPTPGPDPIEQFSRLQAIRGLMQGQQLQQQQLQQEQALEPGRLQLQGEQVKGAQFENQQRQIDLQNVQKAQEYWTDPSKFQGATGTKTAAGSGFAENALGLQSDDPLAQHINGMIRAGVNPTMGPNSAIATGKQLLDFRSNVLKQTADQQKVTTDGLATINKILTPIAAESDLGKRTAMLKEASPTLEEASRFDPSIHQAVMTADPNHLDKITTMTGALQDITNYGKTEREADPVYKWTSNPDELAKPGAQAAIQAQIDDPKTAPQDKPRLQALLPKAQVAQNAVIAQKDREQKAQQAITQGDPDAAGKLLASRTLTLDELKLRQATPQFIENAVMAAQKYDPSFKAPEAAAQAAIAKAPANQMFFGNADSLIIKGGTLDQLSQAGKNLGNSQLPVWNSVENMVKASLGSGPVAAYAAAVLNVADDQAKVMGGTGAATDTARKQSFDLFGRNLPTDAREASIAQVRLGVLSQRRGRVGQNPYLKDMYPEPETAQPGAAAPGTTQHVPGGKAAGLTEGQTGTGSDGKKYIVKGGVWQAQ
jgi:hypothetical protein